MNGLTLSNWILSGSKGCATARYCFHWWDACSMWDCHLVGNEFKVVSEVKGFSNIGMVALPNLHLKASCRIWYPRQVLQFERRHIWQNYQIHRLHHLRRSHHRDDGISSSVILFSKMTIGLKRKVDAVWTASFFFSELESEKMGKIEFRKN